MSKKIVKILALVLMVALLAGCGSSGDKNGAGKKQVLNLYSWTDYFAPEVIEQFEKENNCKVTYDVFSNNEELLAKMQAGGAQYDIIQPSDYMVTTMVKLGMLDKLDLAKMPNLKNIAKELQKPAFDPTGEYAPIFTHGITGIVYNKKYIKNPPTSWDDLWKPEYKGHVILLNDSREVFSFALKKHGWSNNSKDPKQVETAFKDLVALNKNVIAYDTENIKQKFIAEEGWIGQMWSGDAAFANRENKDLAFMIPAQGTLIWADTFAIPKGCKNKELAEKFINFMYDPKISAKNFSAINLPNANAAAAQYMSEEYKNNPIITLGNKSGKLGEWLVDIGDAITMYDKYWTELKASK
jgi:spermidine/putrescine transport system substrate-binding protein